MKTITALFFVLIFITTGFAGQSQTGDCSLVLHITGFDNAKGVAKVGIVNSKQAYEQEGNLFMGFDFEIVNNEILQTISLPRGEYAVKVYHDENKNEKLDTRMFGIPAERYGFSNNARGTFGPPAYEDARFYVESGENEISIKVK